MTPTTTRRALLAGGTMLFAGSAVARQATTLRLFSFGWEVAAALFAAEVSRRTEGRYEIEKNTGFDMLEASLGKERTAGGERALIEGVRGGDVDLFVGSAHLLGDYVPQARVFFL